MFDMHKSDWPGWVFVCAFHSDPAKLNMTKEEQHKSPEITSEWLFYNHSKNESESERGNPVSRVEV